MLLTMQIDIKNKFMLLSADISSRRLTIQLLSVILTLFRFLTNHLRRTEIKK